MAEFARVNKTLQTFSLTTVLLTGALLTGCATTSVPDPKATSALTAVPPAAPVPPEKPAPATEPAPASLLTPVAPMTTATPSAPVSGAFHTVRRGDTGYRIARDYHLTLAALSALNPGVHWAKLRVGQSIRVRAER